MGGKNAIIVDEDADLDEAVTHILASAFGYQGQKCSAASRLISVGRVHERLLARLSDALASWPLGPPADPQFRFGPLINEQALDKAQRYFDIGRAEGRLVYQGKAPAGGHYFAPAMFADIQPHHRLAREEIFAPILAVLHAPDFEAALTLANDSDYALTGGVFSRLPQHLDAAQRQFRVGNLYLNRGITGARVGIQPFGGIALSGTGVQAGSEDTLRQFVWSRVVSGNQLRHGYVPGTSR
ncbi:MAG: aldehyde dehydrogenase family protein [Candidatus Thermoplasmatota archaeon]|nr:aldehyde dehydrogenase family protein [Candidatus Thermoplasmatota archaeon]